MPIWTHTTMQTCGAPIIVSALFIGGPYNGQVPQSSTPAGSASSVPTRQSGDEETACATRILSTLARRAYRRPSRRRIPKRSSTSTRAGRADGDFDAGIRSALERVLASPDFLFRVEREPAKVKPGINYRISDVELASRLSFFLWSSGPDDELLDIARRGSSRSEGPGSAGQAHAGGSARTRRAGRQLLRAVAADPQRVADHAGHQRAFPWFDDNLRIAFVKEMELFLEAASSRRTAASSTS